MDSDVVAKNRFENFKLGPKHGHARSHSRTQSVSNDFSFPASTPAPAPAPAPAQSKRNSHHRRRSSVSTRRESAELMGVSLPDLPPSTSEDNINLGEKDSIRRRALWALEGKPDVSFSKVEIPDISTPEVEKMMFDFSTKPAVSSSNFGMGSKRDSFKLLRDSSSSKDQLHTLVEEEEEEEECTVSSRPQLSLATKENVPPAPAVTKPAPSKPRPSNLNLRPLSLTPENLITATQGLPTPTLTPSPRTGLRSLSLTPSDDSTIMEPTSIKQSRRNSLVILPRRPVLNLSTEQLDPVSTDDEQAKPSKRSSISYKRNGSVTMSVAGLPTPEMTPTFAFGRRYSNAESVTSADDEFFPAPQPTQSRPLSASEQHFLFKSHNALLARITDLERALSVRRRESGGGYSSANGGSSRPMSFASSASSASDLDSLCGARSASSEPSDEMLNLISDLKAERDELKRDVDGWRTRVANLENQTGVLAKRVENERRDAWVARSRMGLLEVEKGVLVKKLEAVDELLALHDREKELWEQDRFAMRREAEGYKTRIGVLEEEVESVRKELEAEKAKKEADPLATPTPRMFGAVLTKKHGLGFMSVDSESSATDVEPDSSDDGRFALKSVQEEEDDCYSDDDDDENGLAGYEDEEDTDNMSIQSSSSFGSDQEMLRSTEQAPNTPTRQVFTPPRPTHVSRATLSRTWTFPKGLATTDQVKPSESVDHFFGCFNDSESDTSGPSVPSSPSAYSYEKSKGAFSSGFKFASEDDNASFFLPPGVGVPADVDDDDEEDETRLSFIAEEDEDDVDEEEVEAQLGSLDEDDDDMFGEVGGIRITFTPPQEEPEVKESKQLQVSPVKRTSPPPMLPALDFGGFEDEDEQDQEDGRGVIPFNFGQKMAKEREPLPPPVVVAAPITPPSSIPRPTAHVVRPTSPSSIPRPAAAKPVVEPFSPPCKALPMRAFATPVNSFVTPPTKRGGAVASFIPQPVSSPSPMRTIPAAKPKVVPTSTFIRQPTRKPLLPSTNLANAKTQNEAGSNTNVSKSVAMNNRPFRRSTDTDHHAASPASFFDSLVNNRSSSQMMKSIDLSHDYDQPPTLQNQNPSQTPSQPVSSIMSSPLASRLSFQTFTNFIPLSWAPRASANPAPSSAFHSAASSLSDHTVIAPVPSGGYVSREKQLHKLKTRMEVEGVVAMKSHVDVQCRKCDGGLVFI